MFSEIKHKIRRRLLGRSFQQQLLDDHRTLSRRGNHYYFSSQPSPLAPGFQPPINAYEYSYYSQNGEDGLILYLLSRLGVERHFIVEVGIEDGRECNSANLILNFGWDACLIEAAGHWAEQAKQYFADCKVDARVQILNSMATPENINQLLVQADVPKQIDVLSIDIDSHDYWLWAALNATVPRIVVIEYNASFGPSRSVTIPYGDQEPSMQKKPSSYQGASITAMKKLGEKKGYVLVAGDDHGVNCFFVRRDLATDAGLDTIEPEQAYRPHLRRSWKKTTEEQFKAISHLPLTEID